MSWPPDPPEYDDHEAELMCEGFCLEEGLIIVWFAYGVRTIDEDGHLVFEPHNTTDRTCPWCGQRDEYTEYEGGTIRQCVNPPYHT